MTLFVCSLILNPQMNTKLLGTLTYNINKPQSQRLGLDNFWTQNTPPKPFLSRIPRKIQQYSFKTDYMHVHPIGSRYLLLRIANLDSESTVVCH